MHPLGRAVGGHPTVRGARRRSPAGVATVWTAWAIVSVVAVGAVCLAAAAAVTRQHRLDGAADLVALAAARDLRRGQDPCRAAAAAAAGNAVSLASCQRRDSDVAIVVTDRLELPFGVGHTLVSRARAGP